MTDHHSHVLKAILFTSRLW